MTDLEAAVPPHEPAEDTLALVGKMGLSAIPIVGQMAAETLAHALETRQAQRQHDFNVTIARALTAALERLDDSITIEEVVESDDFLAALTRAQRAASETSSESKRARLAAAVARSGSWAQFARSEREQFLRLAESFGDLHVWLLHYLDDGVDWLRSNNIPPLHTTEASNENPLNQIFHVPLSHWWGPVSQATDDLERERLVAIPTELADWPARQLSARTTPKGRHFLRFLAEPSGASAEPPRL